MHESLPDRLSLTRIHERYGLKVFRHFFDAIIERCIETDPIRGKELYFIVTKAEAMPRSTLWSKQSGTCSMRRFCKRGNLTENVEYRGTTFNLYRNVLGRKGRRQDHLRVFLRAGKPCPGCGGKVVKEKVGGRATFLCPTCQLENRRDGEQRLTLLG